MFEIICKYDTDQKIIDEEQENSNCASLHFIM